MTDTTSRISYSSVTSMGTQFRKESSQTTAKHWEVNKHIKLYSAFTLTVIMFSHHNYMSFAIRILSRVRKHEHANKCRRSDQPYVWHLHRVYFIAPTRLASHLLFIRNRLAWTWSLVSARRVEIKIRFCWQTLFQGHNLSV